MPAALKVLLYHALPSGPVVRIPSVPDVELMRDAFRTHDAIEVLILTEALIVPAGREDVSVAAVMVEEPRIFEVGQIMRGQIVIAVLVIVAAQKVGQVEGTGH